MLKLHSENIIDDFNRIADELFNNYLIQVNKQTYRLLEIEFYYHGEKHDDKYTHQHPLQKQMGRWYFHGSGIDLTFGNEKEYGGILLRSIEKLNDNNQDDSGEYFIGPLLTKTELMAGLQSPLENEVNVFKLKASAEIKRQNPICCTRINLSQKHTSANEYLHKPYRYVIKPHLKGHKGKTEMAKLLLAQGEPTKERFEEIRKIMDAEYLNPERSIHLSTNK